VGSKELTLEIFCLRAVPTHRGSSHPSGFFAAPGSPLRNLGESCAANRSFARGPRRSRNWNVIESRSRIVTNEVNCVGHMTRRETFENGIGGGRAFSRWSVRWGNARAAQNAVEVPFTDIPSAFNPNNPNAPVRMLELELAVQ